MNFTIFKENPKYMTKMKKFKVIQEVHLSSLDIAHIRGGQHIRLYCMAVLYK